MIDTERDRTIGKSRRAWGSSVRKPVRAETVSSDVLVAAKTGFCRNSQSRTGWKNTLRINYT